MSKQVGFLAAAAVALVLLSITAGCKQHASEASVDPIAAEFFETLKSGDLDKAMGMYSEEFFELYPRETWHEKLQRLTTDLGPIKAYSFRNKQADTRYSGKFYIYQYDTLHESGGQERRVKHTVTFIQSIDSPDIKLVGHRIVAPGFE